MSHCCALVIALPLSVCLHALCQPSLALIHYPISPSRVSSSHLLPCPTLSRVLARLPICLRRAPPLQTQFPWRTALSDLQHFCQVWCHCFYVCLDMPFLHAIELCWCEDSLGMVSYDASTSSSSRLTSNPSNAWYNFAKGAFLP